MVNSERGPARAGPSWGEVFVYAATPWPMQKTAPRPLGSRRAAADLAKSARARSALQVSRPTITTRRGPGSDSEPDNAAFTCDFQNSRQCRPKNRWGLTLE